MSTDDAYRAHRDAAQAIAELTQANSELTAKVRRLETKPKGLQKAEIAGLLGLPEKATDRMIVQKIHALMTKAGQPVGAERLKRALTVRNAEEKKRTLIPFEGEWREAFGQPEYPSLWFVWGKSANGKTTFALKLCRELARYGRVVYNSLEEGDNLTFVRTMRLAGLADVKSRFTLVPGESMEDFDRRLSRPKSPDIAVIDSLQCTEMGIKAFREFCHRHAGKMIIVVSRADGNKPQGRTAGSVMYDAQQKIHVDGFRAFSHGRSHGPKGYYDIWKERAEEIHGGNS